MDERPTGYPPGYRDPQWDGSCAQFASVVLPAWIAALQQTLNEAFADVLPAGIRFEHVSQELPG